MNRPPPVRLAHRIVRCGRGAAIRLISLASLLSAPSTDAAPVAKATVLRPVIAGRLTATTAADGRFMLLAPPAGTDETLSLELTGMAEPMRAMPWAFIEPPISDAADLDRSSRARPRCCPIGGVRSNPIEWRVIRIPSPGHME